MKILARTQQGEITGSRFGIDFASYIELTKPRILSMVLVTFWLGYFLAPPELRFLSRFLWGMAGTALVVGGAGALNHYLERDLDALMRRTKKRALPSGRIEPVHALIYGISLVLIGTILLVLKVNLLTGFLALLSAFMYVVVYTPFKRITPLNTLIGAIPGALPPLGGWAAATGSLDIGGWILFFILFAWQQPHFYSIAWIFKEDYRLGGFKMLPVVEEDGRATFREVITYAALLIPISLLLVSINLAGNLYYFGAFALGLGYLAASIHFTYEKTDKAARLLLKASVLYLPVLFLVLIIDRLLS